MVTFITSIHIIVSILLVLIVLVQQGKGAEMGATFGGGSQSMFGPRGAGNLLTKITYGCATVFILTSLSLAYLSAQSSRESIFRNTPAVAEAPSSQPVTELPASSAAGSEAAEQTPPASQETAPAAGAQDTKTP